MTTCNLHFDNFKFGIFNVMVFSACVSSAHGQISTCPTTPRCKLDF